MSFSKLRKRLLPDAPPGVDDFWATVHVKFVVPVPDVDDPTKVPAQGYYRMYGIRCAEADVPTVISGAVSDGRIVWSDTQWALVDPETLRRDVRKQIREVSPAGIWYRSGQLIYADPELEPRPS